MKKLLFLTAAIIGLYLVGTLIRGNLNLTKAEEFSRKSLVAFARPWSAHEFDKRASSSLLSGTAIAERSRLIKNASDELGELINPGEFKCELARGADAQAQEKVTYAICISRATFQKKTSKVALRLTDVDDQWTINDFVSDIENMKEITK